MTTFFLCLGFLLIGFGAGIFAEKHLLDENRRKLYHDLADSIRLFQTATKAVHELALKKPEGPQNEEL